MDRPQRTRLPRGRRSVRAWCTGSEGALIRLLLPYELVTGYPGPYLMSLSGHLGNPDVFVTPVAAKTTAQICPGSTIRHRREV